MCNYRSVLVGLMGLLMFAAVAVVPLLAAKKPKTPPPPTQPDIVKGCIAIRNIRFETGKLLKLNANAGMWGSITNSCAREIYLTVDSSFFDAYGNEIGDDQIRRLVPEGETAFRSVPHADTPAVYAKAGRITDVYAMSRP